LRSVGGELSSEQPGAPEVKNRPAETAAGIAASPAVSAGNAESTSAPLVNEFPTTAAIATRTTATALGNIADKGSIRDQQKARVEYGSAPSFGARAAILAILAVC
jgi:hypothetical protein